MISSFENPRKLAITCELGDPKNETIWSGTPYNLYKGFADAGVSVLAVDANLGRIQRRIASLYQQLSGGNILSQITLMEKNLRAFNSFIRLFPRKDIRNVLHVCTGDMPVWGYPKHVRHFIFCDITWHLWIRHATNAGAYNVSKIRQADDTEKKAYGQARHIFSISEYVKDDLVSHYQIPAKRVTVVGTGRGKIKPYIGEKRYDNGMILFAAKNRFEDKGGLLLLEGFRIAQKKMPHLNLTIVGSGYLQSHAKGIPNVTVTGFISWEKLQELFYSSSLYAMPAYNEPWGLVYLEALACKTPILGLNRHSIPELTQNGRCGYIVDAPEAAAVAQALCDAFADTELLGKKGEQGQRYCLETFSWESTIQKMMPVIFPEHTEDRGGR